MLLSKRNTPGWIILVLDLGIITFSLFLAYLVRFNFSIPPNEIETFYYSFPFVLLSRGILAFVFKIHQGIVRYTSSSDTERIFIALSVGTAWIAVANLTRYFLYDEAFMVPYSVLIIEYLASIFFMVSARFAVKILYFEIKNASKDKINVLIYGAGDSAILTKRTLDRDDSKRHNVVGFIDTMNRRVTRKVEGVQIFSSSRFEEILRGTKIDNLIFATENITPEERAKVIEQCLVFDVKVLNVPKISDWINGELTYKQIKNVKIEDLLGRPEIKLDVLKMQKSLSGKTVLITGAAGSIGSEIVRQIARFSPQQIVLIDQAESGLYEIEQELLTVFKSVNFEVVLADIANQLRMQAIFEYFKPEIVYHAAAYKHVPLMELNPYEAIRTNNLGTKILVENSIKNRVERFVFVSTDKAVNPTNVMGASKRAAEKFVQAMQSDSETKFITTRFGNVLGSNGSVIPLFKKQIEQGGPITITHPEITRYFMTIPEACQLVLEAGTMGNGGEIYLFDMGKSIKIIDLAKKMIKLSGLKMGEDIEIKEIGLRPGEKLYEELLASEENSLKTHHPQIMIAKTDELPANHFLEGYNQLLSKMHDYEENMELVQNLKLLVPEYRSNNSEYAALDKK